MTVIDLEEYIARIATNSCNDVLRLKKPSRTRLKYNLRLVLTHHEDFDLEIGSLHIDWISEWRHKQMSRSRVTSLEDVGESCNFESGGSMRVDGRQVLSSAGDASRLAESESRHEKRLGANALNGRMSKVLATVLLRQYQKARLDHDQEIRQLETSYRPSLRRSSVVWKAKGRCVFPDGKHHPG
jgi:hypothetical protein